MSIGSSSSGQVCESMNSLNCSSVRLFKEHNKGSSLPNDQCEVECCSDVARLYLTEQPFVNISLIAGEFLPLTFASSLSVI
jgi:hypothetical protein